MPLGFLKKKRTREGNGENPTSSPTSPVAPAAAKPPDSTPVAAGGGRLPSFPLPPTSAAAGGGPATTSPALPNTSPNNTSPNNAASNTATAAASTGNEDVQMSNVTAQPAYPAGYLAAPTPEHQNLPSISNLINQPQQHGIPAQQPAQQQYLTQPDTHLGQTVSPGTDPDKLAQAQAASAMAPPAQPTPEQGAQQQAHGVQANQPSQPAAASNQHAQYTGVGAGAQDNQGQGRVTKGKYSLQDFEILRTLGTGSFGRVHLVQSKHNTRFYAIKVLKKVQVVKMKQVEHTNDERRMLGEVKHPFLVTLWGTFQDSKNLYMVMDFVEGGELFSLLRKSGVSPPCC